MAIAAKTKKHEVIIFKAPKGFKERLNKVAEKGKRTEFIIKTIDMEIMRRERIKWMDEYEKSGKSIHIQEPSRNWPTDRLYNGKNG
jgi:hypothetical protein